MLDIGIKASITGVTAITLKDAADRITADERDPITALSRAGSPTVTGDYLSSLQDKSAPAHTGNTQLADTTLRNTAGVTDTSIKATITPIPDGPGRDDLAYLAEDNQYVPSPKHALGGWGTPMDLSDTKAQEVLNNSIQGGKQRYGITDGKLYEFQPDNVGGWHGYPISGTEAPPKILPSAP